MRPRRLALALAIPAIAAVSVAAIGLRGHVSSAPAVAARAMALSTPAPQTAVSPPPRTGAAFAWDGAHHVDVLFGGSGPAGALDDTWTWDGLTWREQHPAASPPAMSAAAAAWDPGRGRLILVGRAAAFQPGASLPLMTNGDWQTWTWNGSAWQRDAAAGIATEAAETAVSLAYDASARRMVAVVAGHDREGDVLAHSYTWGDGRWNVLDGGLVVGGTDLASVWDSAAGRLRLLQAENARGAASAERQWTWDGTEWKQLADAPGFFGFEPGSLVTSPFAPGLLQLDPAGVASWNGRGWKIVTALEPAPPQLSGFAVAPDPDRGTVVLFGGVTRGTPPGSASNETWTWDGRAWASRGGVLVPLPSPTPHPTGDSACPVMHGPPGTAFTHMGSTLQVAITLPVMPPGCATRSLEIGVVDDNGTPLAIQGNPIRLTTAATHLTVRWSNWCGGGPSYLGVGIDHTGSSSETVRPPSCAAGSQPSTLRLVASS